MLRFWTSDRLEEAPDSPHQCKSTAATAATSLTCRLGAGAVHASTLTLCLLSRRLDSRLEVQCRDTIKELCPGVRCAEDAPCGGTMLRCLTDRLANVTDGGCRQVRSCCGCIPALPFLNDAKPLNTANSTAGHSATLDQHVM